MNLLRQCTFVDRFRNSNIELDDIIEERYTRFKSDGRTILPSEFHLILYFTANWLPDTCNKNINKKLHEFYKSESVNKNFEIVFISSDRTKDSYNEFLNENTFVRYALLFQEDDLKNQLCKFFNINGVPNLTIVTLKLDSNNRLESIQTDKSNLKQQFLSDPMGDKFPWSSSTFESYLTSKDDEASGGGDTTAAATVAKDASPVGVEASVPSNCGQEEGGTVLSILRRDSDETSNSKSDCSPQPSSNSSGSATEDPVQKNGESGGQRQSESAAYKSEKKSTPANILKEILDNLVPCNEQDFQSAENDSLLKEYIDKILRKNMFLFILFGSKKSYANKSIIRGLVEFWNQFHIKHKFDIVYIAAENTIDEPSKKSITSAWFTLNSANKVLKKRVIEFYGITSVPKLLIIDLKSGQLLNNNLKVGLIEFIHDYCNKQMETMKNEPNEPNCVSPENENIGSSNEPREPPREEGELSEGHGEEEVSVDQQLENSDELNLDSFNLNFDMEAYDICSSKKKHRRDAAKSASSSSSAASARAKLDQSLLDDLNKCLFDITTGEKFTLESQSPIPNTGSPHELKSSYYLLYFCSNLTTNPGLFEKVRKFLEFMTVKVGCRIRIVLISSDHSEGDFKRLLDKYKLSSADDGGGGGDSRTHEFTRLALEFHAKNKIKEKLFQQLHIMGIPWFSLVNALNGEVLCENLKLFILNSQLREMIF